VQADQAERPARSLSVNGERLLVVIELQGGNDGLAMLTPLDQGRLLSSRPDLVAEPGELVDAGSGFGWNPNLATLAASGISAAVGVGSNDPGFSHFEMEQRWWRGESGEQSRLGTGFFGRLCDQLDKGAPVTGLALAGGATPALSSDKAVTVGLSDPGSSWFFREENPWLDAHRATLTAMSDAAATDDDRFAAARQGLDNTMRFAASLGEFDPDGDDRYPWTDLGQQLRLASQVIQVEAGVRVLHVQLGGFDTHTGQRWRHDDLMSELGEAVTVFVEDLTEQGRRDDTLIVTTSEFGRRVEQNDGGTDHGGASTMMVCAPGATGVHGHAPNLGQLDDGNIVATARFEDYYATIAEDWFGVSADLVLPSGSTPISGLI